MPSALGIIAFTDPSIFIRGVSRYRPVAAYSYVGRYRLVDIPISNMANSGVQNLHVYTNGNPKVLFDHIGSARHYNINNKHGHISIIPVMTDGVHLEYISDMASYYTNLDEIEDDPNDYVIIAPVNFVYKINYSDLLNTHINSQADVSVLYKHVDTSEEGSYLNAYKLEIASKKEVKSFSRYIGGSDSIDMSLATYVMSKKVFKDLIVWSYNYSPLYWMTDALNTKIAQGGLTVNSIQYNHPVFPIFDLKTYFSSNMAMLQERNMAFFNDPNWPIYTRTNDSPPTIYIGEGTSQGALISNGCEIEGKVSNSILGRGVKVGKNAQVDNCLILPGAVIGDNVMITQTIVDKDAKIVHTHEISGYVGDPYYVDRRRTV